MVLGRTLREGPAWEMSSSEIIAKVSAKRFKTKRIGVKAAKAAERMLASKDVLGQEEATEYRALAVRANYLALDRPDVAYATKELCRCFQSPTKTAVDQPHRLVRYLIGKPRLVLRFLHQPPSSE